MFSRCRPAQIGDAGSVSLPLLRGTGAAGAPEPPARLPPLAQRPQPAPAGPRTPGGPRSRRPRTYLFLRSIFRNMFLAPPKAAELPRARHQRGTAATRAPHIAALAPAPPGPARPGRGNSRLSSACGSGSGCGSLCRHGGPGRRLGVSRRVPEREGRREGRQRPSRPRDGQGSHTQGPGGEHAPKGRD